MTFLDFANMNPQEFIVILILIAAMAIIYFSLGVFVGVTWFKAVTPEDIKAAQHTGYYGEFWERELP